MVNVSVICQTTLGYYEKIWLSLNGPLAVSCHHKGSEKDELMVNVSAKPRDDAVFICHEAFIKSLSRLNT